MRPTIPTSYRGKCGTCAERRAAAEATRHPVSVILEGPLFSAVEELREGYRRKGLAMSRSALLRALLARGLGPMRAELERLLGAA